jgi:hypothetical protein
MPGSSSRNSSPIAVVNIPGASLGDRLRRRLAPRSRQPTVLGDERLVTDRRSFMQSTNDQDSTLRAVRSQRSFNELHNASIRRRSCRTSGRPELGGMRLPPRSRGHRSGTPRLRGIAHPRDALRITSLQIRHFVFRWIRQGRQYGGALRIELQLVKLSGPPTGLHPGPNQIDFLLNILFQPMR